MPLTFAHPAIVLPLNYLPKRWVSLTGLIIGSVVPDFEYFIRMKVYSIYSHTWLGLLWFDVSLAFILTFVYHNIVRDMLISNMPTVFNNRLAQYKGFNWNEHCGKHWIVVIISIIIGSASHLFWDSFTHQNGYFVILFNMTRTVKAFGLHLPLYKVVQHISTLIGGVIVLIAIFKTPATSMSKLRLIYLYWVSVFAIMAMVLILRAVCGLVISQYPNLIVTALSGFIVGIILVPVVFKVTRSYAGNV